MSVFDSAKKVMAGDVAHDAADSGNPVKTGGKAIYLARGGLPAVVSSGDRVDAWYDYYGRAGVNVYGGYKRVNISPADPTHESTSDITQHDGTAIEAGDLTIRDTSAHRFYIPMAQLGYRTAVIYIENDSVAWDQAPLIEIFGAVNIGGGQCGAQLLKIIGVVTASNRIAIGVGAGGLGAVVGITPVPAIYSWYQCDAIAAGWEYLELRLTFSVAPSQGEFDDIVIIRQG